MDGVVPPGYPSLSDSDPSFLDAQPDEGWRPNKVDFHLKKHPQIIAKNE